MGPNASERQAYLESHPELDSQTRTAIYEGELRAGLSEEQVLVVASQPAAQGPLQGLYDEQWSYYSTRDTTWVFFKAEQVVTIDGTAPLYRFPEIQRKKVVLRFVLDDLANLIVTLERDGDFAGHGVVRIDARDDGAFRQRLEDRCQRALQPLRVRQSAERRHSLLDVPNDFDLFARTGQMHGANAAGVDLETDCLTHEERAS